VPPSALEGTIIVWNPNGVGDLHFAALPDLRLSPVSSQIPATVNEVGLSRLVSPDGFYLAFTETELDPAGDYTGPNRLRVIDATGADAAPPLPDPRFGIVTGWSSDGRVILQDAATADGSMIVVDPHDASYLHVPALIPNLDPYTSHFWYHGVPFEVLDPSITRALTNLHYTQFDLWDIPTATTVAALRLDTSSFFIIPQWAPDASGILLSIVAEGREYREDLLFVGRQGATRRLTDLAHSFDAPYISAVEASWSPDSSKIAFWVTTEGGPNPYLARFFVLDPLSLDRTDFCVTDDGVSFPVWSPDSRYVALHQGILVDTQTRDVYNTALPGIPLGWLRATH
jgi:hypothetical protein